MRAYHGTSDLALIQIRAGSARVTPVYTESNVSLGGTYLAADRFLADVAAKIAAQAHSGRPVRLMVEIKESELLPDEDWVVSAAESPEGVKRGRRIDDFMDDLFVGYFGEGFSLSDHYRERYNELNRDHLITWKDSWTWSHTARIARILVPKDIVSAQDLVSPPPGSARS